MLPGSDRSAGMTKQYANMILTLWKLGARNYPESVITEALCATGDIT